MMELRAKIFNDLAASLFSKNLYQMFDRVLNMSLNFSKYLLTDSLIEYLHGGFFAPCK